MLSRLAQPATIANGGSPRACTGCGVAWAALLPTLAVLWGCPQSPLAGSTSSTSTTGVFGTFGTTGLATGSTNSTGTGRGSTGNTSTVSASNITATNTSGTPATSSMGSSTSTGSVGTGTTGMANCDPSGSTPPPAIQCSMVDGGVMGIIAGQTVEIDCSGPAGIGYSVVSSIGGATILNDIETRGKAYVTHKAPALGAYFPDSTATVTVTACAAGGQPASAGLPINLVGDLITADYGNKVVESFASDGTDMGPFVPAATLAGQPSMVARLSSNQILVGRVAVKGSPTLQVYDFHGTHQFDFAETDDALNGLWEVSDYPFAAVVDGQGNTWVTRISSNNEVNGALYQFDSTGAYLQTVAMPPDFQQYINDGVTWQPEGLIILPSGSIVTTIGSVNTPLVSVYPSSGTPTTIQLALGTCEQNATAQGYTCSPDTNDLYWSTLSMLNLINGVVYTGSSNFDDDFLFGTLDTQLNFTFATDTGNGEGISNVDFVSIEQMGPSLVASQGTAPGGCLATVDPSDLAPSTSCWSTGGSTGFGLVEIEGIMRLH